MTRRVGVEFSFYGEKQINAQILALDDRVQDASPAFNQVAIFLRRVERKQWSTKGALGGNPWAKLKPATIRAKVAKGGTAKKNARNILRESDALWKSVTTKSKDSITEIGNDSLFFSTRVDYGVIHQTGAPRNNMPARRVFDLNAMTRNEILRVIGAFITNGSIQKGVFR